MLNYRPTHVSSLSDLMARPDGLLLLPIMLQVTPLYDLHYYYPVFFKTTDGGLTWGDPIPVRLDGPTAYMAF